MNSNKPMKRDYSSTLLFFSLMLFASFFGVSACNDDYLDPPIPVKENIIVDSSTVYIAVFGDIQYLTNASYIKIYQQSLNWIQEKANEGWLFNYVLHTGDITMSNTLSQWNCFYQATDPLARRIPYISMIGDHDYTWEDGIHIADRSSTRFNDYVRFPLSTSKVIAYYEEGKMENIVVENSIYGQRLDLLVLEFGPRKEVVAWADAYVKSHPDHRFILMTHEYLEMGGGRRVSGLKSVIRLLHTNYTTPKQLWDKLIKCNDNICLVLCGHVGGLYAVDVEENDFGHEVTQIQHNIQGSKYRYDNWIMLWSFPEKADSANVSIYNTATGDYYQDKQTLFKFKYRDSDTLCQ